MTQDWLPVDAGQFERHRPRLFGIAYRMLGSVEDAEDVVQESFLRWDDADPAEVRSAEAWLVAVTTRLAIDRLRRAATERRHYAGNWLPEPIATAPEAADRRAELASDLSMAFLVLLERLLERFLAALAADDQEALLALVAEDATWTADGGGKVAATRRVVRGASRIVRLVLGFERKGRGMVRHGIVWLNGEPAIVTHAGNRLLFTTSADTDGERIVAFYRVLNPDKLRHADGGA